jgi:hypothetical protein
VDYHQCERILAGQGRCPVSKKQEDIATNTDEAGGAEQVAISLALRLAVCPSAEKKCPLLSLGGVVGH